MDVKKVKECIGCGFCCTKAKCAAGQRLYPAADLCPALKWNGTRHVCDLMQLPGMLGEIYRQELFAGEGCCMNLNSWRKEPLQDRTSVLDKEKSIIPPIMQKFLSVLGKQFVAGDTIFLTCVAFAFLLKEEGMSDDEANDTAKLCAHYIKEQRSSFTREFLG